MREFPVTQLRLPSALESATHNCWGTGEPEYSYNWWCLCTPLRRHSCCWQHWTPISLFHRNGRTMIKSSGVANSLSSPFSEMCSSLCRITPLITCRLHDIPDVTLRHRNGLGMALGMKIWDSPLTHTLRLFWEITKIQVFKKDCLFHCDA